MGHGAYLQSIFPRKALVAVGTRERLYSQMNSFVALEIVIPVETLRALVACEGSVRGWGGDTMRRWMPAVQVLRAGDLPAVKPRQQARLHPTHHGHRSSRTVDIAHDGTIHSGEGIGRPWLAGVAEW